jgi:hypothetical protein
MTVIRCGRCPAAKTGADELAALGREKGTLIWASQGLVQQGVVLALTGTPSEAVRKIAAGIAGFRSTGGTAYVSDWLTYLAEAHAELGHFDDAWRCISEAVTEVGTTKETWCEAEINRTAGRMALKSPQPNIATAQAYFERALAVPANIKQNPGNSAPL